MAEQVQKPSKYLRFDRSQRIEHAVLVISFTILGITGLPQMYPDSWIGNGMIRAMGGIEMIRIIHRASAVILIILSIYHVSAVIYKIYVRRIGLSMLPGWKDVTDAGHQLAYNLGRAPEGPAMPRYTFAEKMEYWAVVWGTLVMIITGFMLWNPIATTRFFPGQFIPVSKAAHGGEALLARPVGIVVMVVQPRLTDAKHIISAGDLQQRGVPTALDLACAMGVDARDYMDRGEPVGESEGLLHVGEVLCDRDELSDAGLLSTGDNGFDPRG